MIFISKILDKKELLINSGERFQTAGRIRNVRNDGLFFIIQDFFNSIQCFHKIDKSIKSGKNILLTGYLGRTKTKEITIFIEEINYLSEIYQPIQKELYGTKQSGRVMELISSNKDREALITRYKIINSIKEILIKNDFFEVDTPILQEYPGGAIAEPFSTFYNFYKSNVFMRIAPELFLKRLIVAGFNRIFEVAKCFRNEGRSNIHNPEFTLLEAYAAHSDRSFMMDITEKIIMKIFSQNNVNSDIIFKVFSFEEAFDIAIKDFESIESAKNKFEVTSDIDLKEKLVTEYFVKQHKYVHIIDHPEEISPLAKIDKDKKAIRFETFINGIEIANGYQEQDNPDTQLLQIPNISKEYIDDLRIGMPPTTGLGIGIERLVLLVSGEKNIRKSITFLL